MNLPLKVDKLNKYDKCIKKLRENLKKISKNRAIKKDKHLFLFWSSVFYTVYNI